MDEHRLDEFARAWQRGDIEALMSFMTDDCTYITTTGPAPGTEYRGRDAVRRGFGDVLAADGRAVVVVEPGHVTGSHGFLEWTLRTPEGVLLARGCDVFEFEGDRVRRKDAFRKVLA